MTAGWIAIAIAVAVALGFFNPKKKPENPAELEKQNDLQGGEPPNN